MNATQRGAKEPQSVIPAPAVQSARATQALPPQQQQHSPVVARVAENAKRVSTSQGTCDASRTSQVQSDAPKTTTEVVRRKLGKEMMKRHWNGITMFRNLDKDAGGSVDKAEFVRNILHLNIVETSAEELEALWDEVCASGLCIFAKRGAARAERTRLGGCAWWH